MTTQNFKYSSAHIKSVTIYPITMVLFTCISNTTLIIKCPLSPHKISDNNPCPTKHASQFSPKEFLIGRYQHWKSDDRASPSPSLLCTHHSFWELAEGTCSMWESHPSWWELFQRETEKPPIKHTKKPPTPNLNDQLLLEIWCSISKLSTEKVFTPLPPRVSCISKLF